MIYKLHNLCYDAPEHGSFTHSPLTTHHSPLDMSLSSRPDPKTLINKDTHDVPMSCQRIMQHVSRGEHVWIGPDQAKNLTTDDRKAYDAAHTILRHLIVQAPAQHSSGHPGGPLSAFTAAYSVTKRRNPALDQPLRMSPGHLSLLSYGLQWMFGRGADDARLASIESIIKTFRTPQGLPGHIEAGIGDTPFGTGPLGKGVSNALGAAFGLKYLKKPGIVDVLLADGDAQEGQVAEAFRLASRLNLGNLMVHGDFNDVQLCDLPSRTMASDFASIAFVEGWHVIEVQNGNDPAQVNAALDEADRLLGGDRPIFICYYTTMGYGISFMEQGSNTGEKNYHGAPLSEDEVQQALKELPPLKEGIATFEPIRAQAIERLKKSTPIQTDLVLPWDVAQSSYKRTTTKEKAGARREFGATHINNLMRADPRIIVLHADLAGSGGFDKAQKEFPQRVINVGVAEANMVMMAAGMRQVGLLPVTYTFAAFGTNEARANMRLIDINCAHTRCGIVCDCTHTGLSVGEDGETHQEQNYLNLPFRHTQVWMAADSNQSAAMAERAMEIVAEGHESVFVFSPRTNHPQVMSPNGEIVYGVKYRFDGLIDLVRGKGDSSDQLTILATGAQVHTAIETAERLASGKEQDTLSVRVLNVSCIRPIDAATIIKAALETMHLLVLEDHNTEGGLASQVADVIADFALPCSLKRLGHRQFFPSGKAQDLLFFAGLDTESVVNAVEDEVRSEVCGGEDAFVTAIHELQKNISDSRFREQALPFLEKLLGEKGYLEELRNVWRERTCPAEKLPTNEQLTMRLSDSMS